MLHITNVNVYGLENAAFHAIRLPMIALDKTDKAQEEETKEKREGRAKRLASTPTGSGHDNFLQGIVVQFDVDFTVKAWTEAQRYHFLDFISSSSTMHALTKTNLDDVYCEYVDKRIIDIVKELQEKYNENPNAYNFLNLVYSSPTGLRVTASMTTNYRQLKTIYQQRRNHRLPEWQDFCDWCETLPHFKEWCIV